MTKLTTMIDNGGLGLLFLAWTTATVGVLSIAL